jgi:hypothetical protein
MFVVFNFEETKEALEFQKNKKLFYMWLRKPVFHFILIWAIIGLLILWYICYFYFSSWFVIIFGEFYLIIMSFFMLTLIVFSILLIVILMLEVKDELSRKKKIAFTKAWLNDIIFIHGLIISISLLIWIFCNLNKFF